jgi:putative membrane protein
MITKRFQALWASAVLSAMIHPAAALAQAAPPYADWPGHWHMMSGWGFWWIFPLLMMVFMIGFCVFFMLRSPWSHGHSYRDNASSAIQLLNERFAKGDISKEEFEEKRTILARRI